MNTLTKLAILATAIFSVNAFAAQYTRLAECTGYTQNNVGARAVLFVDKAADANGMVMVTVANQGDFLSTAKINWRANAAGHPRFFDNDFDLDIVITQRGTVTDDILIGDIYINQLVCEYAPN